MSSEKDLNMSLYFDYYSDFLTEKQKKIFALYFNDDLSLGEISSREGISRQAVYDCIVRARKKMTQMEQKLGLIKSIEIIADNSVEAPDGV